MTKATVQSIPFTIEVLRKIAPSRVIDLDGAGHWPALIRELVKQPEQPISVDAIVECAPPDTASAAYDHISIGSHLSLVADINGRVDAALIQKPLLGLRRDQAKVLLRALLNKSRYLIIDVPLGVAPNDPLENGVPNETSWSLVDLSYLPTVRRSLYRDSSGRLHATIIASNADPKKLRAGLPKIGAEFFDEGPTSGAGQLEKVLDRVADQTFELAFIKKNATYKLGQRLINTQGWNTARWLRNRNRSIVTIRATGDKNKDAQGTQVHIRHAAAKEKLRSIPWDFAEHAGEWQCLPVDSDPTKTFIWAERGRVRLPLGEDPEIRLVKQPFGGMAEIGFRGRIETIDLYADELHEISVFPARNPMVCPPSETIESHRGKIASGAEFRRDIPKSGKYNNTQSAFIEEMQNADADICAVHTPRWLGITASTKELFEHCYPIPNTRDQEPYRYDEDVIKHHADVLIDAGAKHIVFSGGDRSHLRIAEVLHDRDESITIDMLWHGSYVQFLEDYNWEMLRHWIEASKAGIVRSIGTVKAGMEQFLESVGVRSGLVLNLITGDVADPPEIDGDELHLGMWISGTTYRKIPHPMLAAIAMTPNTRLHAAGLETRAIDVINFFNINTAEVRKRTLPHDDLLEAIRQTHLTLYVTFSECCPMIPLESLQLGVPCLIGPNSHLFEDNDYLFSRLVVPFPDRADVIAEYIERAFEEREQIVDAYRRYIPGYNKRAQESVRVFLAREEP
ncbi:MAG: hypothetical protein DRJ50_03435 [Actinobacteria bacterium]|nr:MAG: hypothetical protein DRJ50_03435 [Actinomycetota bacterium]